MKKNKNIEVIPFAKNFDRTLNNQNPIYEEMKHKQIGFSPMVMCSFFQGFDVLQVYSEKAKECVYAVYFADKLVGNLYLGNMYDTSDIADISDKLFPKELSQLNNYINENKGIWYYQYPQNHYAFVLEKILKKIK